MEGIKLKLPPKKNLEEQTNEQKFNKILKLIMIGQTKNQKTKCKNTWKERLCRSLN